MQDVDAIPELDERMKALIEGVHDSIICDSITMLFFASLSLLPVSMCRYASSLALCMRDSKQDMRQQKQSNRGGVQ